MKRLAVIRDGIERLPVTNITLNYDLSEKLLLDEDKNIRRYLVI